MRLFGVVVQIPKFVPSNTKLALSVSAVAPLSVNMMRLAVYEDGVSVSAKKVVAPPEIPRDEVATHCVPVPVVCRTMPAVPEALLESRKAPVAKMSPAIESFDDGVVVQIPTFPVLPTLIR